METKTEAQQYEIVRQTVTERKNSHISCMTGKQTKVIVDVPSGAALDYVALHNILNSELVMHINYNNGDYYTVDGILYLRNKLVRCPIGKIGKVVIPEGITEIKNSAFNMCKDITSVEFPNSLRQIGTHAFSYCFSLKSVDFGSGIEHIGVVNPEQKECLESGQDMFYGCRSLKEITIPEQVKSIGCKTFHCCGLRKINLPKGINEIGADAFSGCENLKEISIPDSLLKNKNNKTIPNIGLRYVEKVIVPELTDNILHAGILITNSFDSDIVEIVTPNDTYYLPRYLTEAQFSKLTSSKIKSEDFLACKYSILPVIGDYATVKRYLYLLRNKRGASESVKEQIKKRWKNIIQFLSRGNDSETLLELIKTDIVTAEMLEYVLQKVKDVTLRAYIMEESSKKEKRSILNV